MDTRLIGRPMEILLVEDGLMDARATIEAFYSSRKLSALKKVLASWDEIAAYYGGDGPREAGPSQRILAAGDAP